MKVKVDDKNEISLSKISKNRHLVVAIQQGSPCILNKNYSNTQGYKFLVLNEKFTLGNNYSHSEYDTLEERVKNFLDNGAKVEVFENKDWKNALQWLIDNS